MQPHIEHFLDVPLDELAAAVDRIAKAKSPEPPPNLPKRPTAHRKKIMSPGVLEPERAYVDDDFREIKHADPYGRVNLGRKHSYATFIVEPLTDGSILLRPAVIVEKRRHEIGSPSLCPRGTSLDMRKGSGDGVIGIEKVRSDGFRRIPTER